MSPRDRHLGTGLAGRAAHFVSVPACLNKTSGTLFVFGPKTGQAGRPGFPRGGIRLSAHVVHCPYFFWSSPPHTSGVEARHQDRRERLQ